MKVYVLEQLHGQYEAIAVYRAKDHAERIEKNLKSTHPTRSYRVREMEMIYDLQPK